MPQICRVCVHPNRDAIDGELSRDWERSLRQMGAEFGLSKDALFRHAQRHLPDIAEDSPSATASEDGEDSPHEKGDPDLNNQQKSNGAAEARQVAQVATMKKEPKPSEARYSAFIERWRGQLGFALYDMADWPEEGEDLQALISEGIERGDLFYYASLKWYCKTAQGVMRLKRDE